MGKVLSFPASRRRIKDVDDLCNQAIAEMLRTESHSEAAIAIAKRNAIAAAKRWPDAYQVKVEISPGIDFTAEQFAEVERVVVESCKQLKDRFEIQVVLERLRSELVRASTEG